MYPRKSSTTHTEGLGDEASVYDWTHAQVHALNPTAARVWRLCDGATSPAAMAVVLQREMAIPEAEAVVELTLKELARLHLLELPVDSREDRPAPTRRWLLERGLAAAMLPAVYTILTPSSLEAQSPGAPGGVPTLTGVAPNQGTQGATVAVTLTGTNFVVGATTVNVSGAGVTVNTVVVGGPTSLTANFVIDAAAATGARTVTVTTAGGTSGGQTFTINLPAPAGPTLTSVTPNLGIQGNTVGVTLTGTNFVVGATTVNVSGGGVTVNTVVVGSTTSLTANFVLDGAAATGARTVTVTTAGGTSGGQTFTINLPAPAGPTLTSVTPNLGVQGNTVGVTLTGTNFVVGATTVNVSGGGVTVNTVVVGSTTLLTASFAIDATAVIGARTVTVTTAAGTSGGQTFTINPPPPTLTSVAPNQGLRGTTVAVTLTGTNFVVGATTVAVAGGDITIANVAVGSSTSLTASFALGLVPAVAARTVTVTTAGGTSGGQTFTINLPAPGSQVFDFVSPTGADQTFMVPAGVVGITIVASGAGGGAGGAGGGLGGRTTATVSVTPGAPLTVRVGGFGVFGGFGGGGQASGFAGRGGGASIVLNGSIPLVVAGGGGGGGSANPPPNAGNGGAGGHGGEPIADPGGSPLQGGSGGGGGNSTQSVGGTGGAPASPDGISGTAGASFQGGTGGTNSSGVISGGGGGGGYFGGGGGGGGENLSEGGGGGGGGGGSSFAVAGATNVEYLKGSKAGNGIVTISW